MVVSKGDNSGSSLYSIAVLSSTANVHLKCIFPIILILSGYGGCHWMKSSVSKGLESGKKEMLRNPYM